MDGSSFDRIARALGAGVSRRSGVFGAIGALTSLGAGMPAIDDVDAKGKRNGTGQHGPGIAGPCGKGRKKNVCTKNSDCCTNICKTKIKNKDKSGRCRCEKKGRPCSEDRNCCGSISCVAGKCGGKAPFVATGAACGPNDICRDPNAECTTYQYDNPAGTYCLLPVKGLCASGSECTSSQCAQGLCRPCSSPACAESCTPIVCASCTHQTVQAAIDAASDGDVIAIGKGTRVEDLTITNTNLTLRACPGDRVTLRNATYGNRTITVTGGSSLTVLDITIDGYQDLANSDWGGGIESDGSVTLAGSTVVKNAAWDTYGGGVRVMGDGLTVTVTDETVVRDCTAGDGSNGGGGIFIEGESDLLISGWAELTGNRADSYGGAVNAGVGANVSISGHVRIVANASGYGGAGVSAGDSGSNRTTTMTVKDDVVIADNVCDDAGIGAGLGIFGPMTALITDRVQVTGNSTLNEDAGGIAIFEGAITTISGNVEISGNRSAGNGGGIRVNWSDGATRPAGVAHVTITDSVRVVDNVAAGNGGGIHVFGSVVEVKGSAVISGNTAVSGGGVVLDYKADGTPANSELTVSGEGKITGNTATNSAPSGGGVWSDDNANTLTAVAGSITGNTPDQCAGGTISC